jgi:hypothetical protein
MPSIHPNLHLILLEGRIIKVFEHCILIWYSKYFITSDNQLSYKRKVGCTTAIHTLRCVTDYHVNTGSTVNLCSLDVSKVFDRLNYHGPFVKLMCTYSFTAGY